MRLFVAITDSDWFDCLAELRPAAYGSLMPTPASRRMILIADNVTYVIMCIGLGRDAGDKLQGTVTNESGRMMKLVFIVD
jgi:hypothetical protein